MKRIIIEYKKLNHTLLSLLSEKFPEGYQDNDIITFSNANGDQIQAIEIRTEDTIYLVKVSKKLKEVIQDFKEDDLFEDLELQ
jgi:DNA-directed RNA polymerase subunit delta